MMIEACRMTQLKAPQGCEAANQRTHTGKDMENVLP